MYTTARSHLEVTVCPGLTGLFDSHEALVVRVKSSSSVYIVATFYRPPFSTKALFNEYIEHEFLTNQVIIGHRAVLTGDFNFNVNKKFPWPASTRDFCSLLDENGFLQHVEVGTRFCPRTGRIDSLIDHIWTNFEQQFSVQTHEKISDHLPVSLSFPLAGKKSTFELVFRDFSAENIRKFERERDHLLQNYNVNSDADIEDEFRRFHFELTTILDRFFPIRKKQMSLKGLDMPLIEARI